MGYIDRSVQDFSISSMLTMETLQSRTKPSIYFKYTWLIYESGHKCATVLSLGFAFKW